MAVARNLERTLITFDKLDGKDGAEVAAELQLEGGSIVQISSGPSQPIYRALAKLLWHFEAWTTFLSNQHGAVVLRDLRQNPDLITVEEFHAKKVLSESSRDYFNDYISAWNERGPSQRTARSVLSPEDQLLTHPLLETPTE